jgi:hypothetical protein
MNQKTTPLIVKLTSYFPFAEKIFFIGLAIGFLLFYTNIDSLVMIASLGGLAVVFFLSAYKVIDIPREENEQFGFQELLGYTIAPKILWISCAVSTSGVLLHMLNNEGYKQMLYIGGTTIAIGTLVMISLLISGVKHINVVIPVLYRAIPLLVLDLYLFFN